MTTPRQPSTELFRSALLAGLIAAFIWMVITALTDAGKGAVVGGGFAFLFGTAIVTAIITSIVTKARKPGS